MEPEEKGKEGFLWITGILFRNKIPFLVGGGLAVRAYGSTRPLNDIDIDVPDAYLPIIAEEAGEHLTQAPARFKNERWDVAALEIEYRGQLIDITGDDTIRINDARTGEWTGVPDDFLDTEERSLFGIMVPVESPERLAHYKSMLVGEHQKEDLRVLEEHLARS
jgi:hypothetical protein